jgi:hypothetical protein
MRRYWLNTAIRLYAAFSRNPFHMREAVRDLGIPRQDLIRLAYDGLIESSGKTNAKGYDPKTRRWRLSFRAGEAARLSLYLMPFPNPDHKNPDDHHGFPHREIEPGKKEPGLRQGRDDSQINLHQGNQE